MPGSGDCAHLRDATPDLLAHLPLRYAQIVLGLAILNLASLLVAWGFERKQEMALRRALGAGTGRVVRLLLQQSVAIVGTGALLGVVLAYVVLRTLQQFDLGPTVTVLVARAQLDAGVLAVTAAVTILCGLAAGALPAWFREVSAVTRTPLNATVLTAAAVLFLALLLPLERLADLTSRITLVLFALVNLALVRIKLLEREVPGNTYVAPRWVPWSGAISCVALLAIDVLLLLIAWMS